MAAGESARTDGAAARRLEAGACAGPAAREGRAARSSRADDDGACATSAETALPPGIAGPAAADNASATSSRSAISIEPAASDQPAVSTPEPMEKAVAIDEEINGVGRIRVVEERIGGILTRFSGHPMAGLRGDVFIGYRGTVSQSGV